MRASKPANNSWSRRIIKLECFIEFFIIRASGATHSTLTPEKLAKRLN
jgi:hypothetical protein